MPYRVKRNGRSQRNRKPRTNRTLQKPNGILAPRVQKVGGERFAIVCVDPAKHRSEWMMADYFGNLLIEPRTLEHRAAKELGPARFGAQKKERRTTAAPPTSAKRRTEQHIGRRSLAGARSKHCLCTKGRRPSFAVWRKQ